VEEDDIAEVHFENAPIDEDDFETEIVAITDMSTGEELKFEIEGHEHDHDVEHDSHDQQSIDALI